jgi:hypothetical protein
VAPIAGSLTQEVAYAMRFPVDSEKRRVVDAARFRASGHAPINRGAGQTGTSDRRAGVHCAINDRARDSDSFPTAARLVRGPS